MNNIQVFLGIILYGAFARGDRRIFGGELADEAKFGYVVQIEVLNVGKCTGCIIHEDWILTAAHCVIQPDQDESVSPKSVVITGGTVNLENKKNAQVRKGKKVIVHEKYSKALAKPDFALIQLNESFKFVGSVRKMGFFASAWPQANKGVWDECVAAGFGKTEDGSNHELKVLRTEAKHGKTACSCIEKFYMLKRLVCLPAKSDEGICFGDSGGALLCEDKIVGVAHVVIDKRNCKYNEKADKNINCGSPHVYGAYVYTCPYLNWIGEYVPNIPKTPESCFGVQNALPIFSQRSFSFMYTVFSLLQQLW